MPAKGFVFIETAVGKTMDVVAALRGVEGVMSVDPVTGPYDVIAVIEGADISAIGRLVTTQMHTVNGVLRTVTCLTTESS
jgi:DNA-binding Lrp family transcriptional regulator